MGEGDPSPTVFWRSDTRRRSDILPEAYEPSPGTAGLIFDPVAVSDSGRYTCVARNDRGTTEENVDLSGEQRIPSPYFGFGLDLKSSCLKPLLSSALL